MMWKLVLKCLNWLFCGAAKLHMEIFERFLAWVTTTWVIPGSGGKHCWLFQGLIIYLLLFFSMKECVTNNSHLMFFIYFNYISLHLFYFWSIPFSEMGRKATCVKFQFCFFSFFSQVFSLWFLWGSTVNLFCKPLSWDLDHMYYH